MEEVMEFIMRLKKTTNGGKACFKENMDRIGRIYLPIPFLERMNIENELLIQLAPNKSYFPQKGYVAKFVIDKETEKKIRYAEDISEKGQLGIIYISKSILELMDLHDEVVVRVVPLDEGGGAAIAQAQN